MPIPQESPTTSSIGLARLNPVDSECKTSIERRIEIVQQFDSAVSASVSQSVPQSQTANAAMPAASLSPTMPQPRSEVEPVPIGAFLSTEPKVPTAGDLPRLRTLQLWEGTITDLCENGFIAVLSDKTNPENPDERGQFSFDRIEISEEDQELVAPGASFYWIIGTTMTRGKTVQNVSMVHFRRTPVWTQRMLSKSAARAETIF